MFISRVLVRNYRNLKFADTVLSDGTSCVIGENNAGKSNFVHCIRLAVDANLSSYSRNLDIEDFSAGLDIKTPKEILVSVEFSDFVGKENQEAFLYDFSIEDGVARITFRFRPRRPVREAIKAKARKDNDLTIGDYGWEIVGGGDKADDREGRMKLAGTMLRAPLSLAKMSYDAATGTVIYRSKRHLGLKRNFQGMPGAQWLALRCKHIPDRDEHLVRLRRRVLEPGTRAKRAKEASPHAAAALPAPSEQQSTEFAARAKATWARLIRKVYAADPLECPKCRSEKCKKRADARHRVD